MTALPLHEICRDLKNVLQDVSSRKSLAGANIINNGGRPAQDPVGLPPSPPLHSVIVSIILLLFSAIIIEKSVSHRRPWQPS
jgi:hypothetical protein